MSERTRFFEALPFHVNRTLDAPQAAWMREYLRRHPELQSQVDFTEAMGRAVQAEVAASLASVPADVGYAATAARIAASRRRMSWGSWWRQVRSELASPGGLRLAQGLAMGLLLGVTLLSLPPSGPTPSAVRGSTAGLADGPLLRVSFKPQAQEVEIRLALIEARALVVAGPTRLGDYYLKTPARHLQAARAALQSSGLVQQADEVPGLPDDLLE